MVDRENIYQQIWAPVSMHKMIELVSSMQGAGAASHLSYINRNITTGRSGPPASLYICLRGSYSI